MKVFLKISLCFLLISSLFVSFFACSIDGGNKWKKSYPFPEGYTGGVQSAYTYHFEHKVIWLDTADEFIDAITVMKSNGVEIGRIPYFDCEETGLDIKFCLTFKRNKNLHTNNDYFAANDMLLSILPVVFIDYISIDELEYSLYYVYEGFAIRQYESVRTPTEYDSIKINQVNNEEQIYELSYNGVKQFYLNSTYKFQDIHEEELFGYFEIFKNTLKIVE